MDRCPIASFVHSITFAHFVGKACLEHPYVLEDVPDNEVIDMRF